MLEPNFYLGRDDVRWERLFFFLALIAVPAILSSCGSSAATTATPTITVSCTPTDVTVLATSQCTASVLNESSTLVNWSISPAGTGSITAGGLYTAPSSVPTNNVVTVTATSQVASTLTATQGLTIIAGTAINAVTCVDSGGTVASTVSSMNTLSCTATTTAGATVPVNWSVTNTNALGGNIGSISAQGIFTAPLVPPPGQKVTITATSQALATETMSVTATAVFGKAVLNGQYAFSTVGRTTAKSFWARVGNFTAGGGSLTGTEDTNQGGSPNKVTTQQTFSGSYAVGPDGRGTMQFCENSSSTCPLGSASATSFFRIVVISPLQAHLIEFSSPTAPFPGSTSITAGGEMILQDPTVYSAREQNLSGTFSFNFSGVSASGTDESVVGEFAANGHGTVSAGSQVAPLAPGEIDINTNGLASMATVLSTSYSINTSGRGTITLNGFTFGIYPVSPGRAKFIEIDAPAPPATTPDSILAGDAYIQQSTLNCGWGPNALNGATVLETSGTSSGVVVQDVASFSAANNAVTAVSMDQNSGGAYTQPAGTGTDNYAMDPCGRGTLSVAGHSYVYYIISTSDAVLQEVTAGVVANGFLLPSPGGTFADSTFKGSYAFKLGGTDAAGTSGSREDFLGQLTSSGLGTGLAGTLDLNDFGATQPGIAIANGTYLAAGGLRGTMILPLATTPSTTRNLVFYMVNPKLFYVLDVDQAPSGTALGAINNQF